MRYYAELGIASTATPAEVRRAYLALARRHHPDRLGDRSPGERARSAARMARVNEAWNVLSDPSRRAAYDRAIDVASAPAGTHGATVRDVGDTFVAFDPEGRGDATDPRLESDDASSARPVHRIAALAPAGLAASAVAASIVGLFLQVPVLFAVGFVLGVLAVLSFLFVPFLALAEASRADRGS